ncbi:MAG TPA: TolC family outer membrane protein [Rhodocyclaceae bacterium]|nr:TolC family outer membrane protein [Rhodocyclaceae bacterium]
MQVSSLLRVPFRKQHNVLLGLVLSTLVGQVGAEEFLPPPDMPEATVAASAQPVPAKQTLKDVVQQSILTQPEVLYRWHAFLAADDEHSASIGGFLPKLDLTAGRGKEKRNDPILTTNYTRNSSSLTLTQMLYDGFFTRNEMKRLDHARMTRLFELQDVTENTALEAVRAYLDVLRYRLLVSLTEENYVRHRSVLEQIQLKVKAGVGRRVDLEQASGRFALAESNLLIETSNLHDVAARFQRLIGTSPAVELEEPTALSKDLPSNANAAQAVAQLINPALRASVENVRSADAAHSGRAAAYQPRVDLRFREDKGRDLNGYVGVTNNSTAEVVMSWNLFNGFSDVNRSRQFAEQLNVARDLRDKTCRDMRQTLAIAYNDAKKLNEQLSYLDQHQLSIEKARDAYRKQFDIGQRTLLDVLDTENELFQAKRAYANAEYDLKLAYARSQAGMGRLLETLGLSRLDKDSKQLAERWAAEGDGAQQCPPDAPPVYVVDKKALDERAAEMLRELAPKTADNPVAAAAEADVPAHSIGLALKAWVATWTGKNVQGYLDSYAKTFIPADGSDLSTWVAKRKAALAKSGDIKIDLSDVKIELRDQTHAVSTFVQTYTSAAFQDVVKKTLEWEKIDGRWLIVGEMSSKLPKSAAVTVKPVPIEPPAILVPAPAATPAPPPTVAPSVSPLPAPIVTPPKSATISVPDPGSKK